MTVFVSFIGKPSIVLNKISNYVVMTSQIEHANHRIGTWANRIENIGIFAVLFITLTLGILQQPYYPATWLDEGFVMQGAINLVRYGEYALRSSEGFRLFDQPLIANGPGLVLPVSLAYKLFGIGLLQARLVSIIYMVATVVLVFTISRRVFGIYAALISAILVLFIPSDGLVFFGRQVIGEIPGIAYFLSGFLLLLMALERDHAGYYIGAGLFFGLAAITKGQYLMILPMIVLMGLADYFYYHSKSIIKLSYLFTAILLGLLLWYGVQYYLLGQEGFLNNLTALSSSSRETVAAFRPLRYPGNLWYLIYSGILFVILPGWLITISRSRRIGAKGLRYFLPAIFIPGWLLWFAFVSVGWHRYALAPYILGTIYAGGFIGRIAMDITSHSRFNRVSILDSQRSQKVIAVYLVLIALYALFGISYQIYKLAKPPDESAQNLSQYLDQNVSSKRIIETWEWEISALAPDLTFHHPTNDWVDLMTRKTQFNEEVVNTYDLDLYRPGYLIDGPFSKFTKIYSPSLAENCCMKIASFGKYDLYEVKSNE